MHRTKANRWKTITSSNQTVRITLVMYCSNGNTVLNFQAMVSFAPAVWPRPHAHKHTPDTRTTNTQSDTRQPPRIPVLAGESQRTANVCECACFVAVWGGARELRGCGRCRYRRRERKERSWEWLFLLRLLECAHCHVFVLTCVAVRCSASLSARL